MNRTLLPVLCLSLLACYKPLEVSPPASFTAAEEIPPRPEDPAAPLGAVVWCLNYDLRKFDDVWRWLNQAVPPGPERARALGAAALIAVAELDRPQLRETGIAAFDEAIPAFPQDARLPAWRAYLIFLKARDANDLPGIATSIDMLRDATAAYPAFTYFGLTLAVGGWEDAPLELVNEAHAAFDAVFAATANLNSGGAFDRERFRRVWDTPIAPYNIPATQVMQAELALRAGKPDEAAEAYYTALHSNNAAHWPWRAEVQRRLDNLDATVQGFAARPATEYSLGSHDRGAMGVRGDPVDPRFGGRVGNGSCTVCHTHVSSFDLGEPAAEVGWVRGRALPIQGAPNAQPIAFLLPEGADPIPAGFGIGPYVEAATPRDFFKHEELYDGTFVVPAAPGTYFVALQANEAGRKYEGYSARELGLQRFITVKAGVMTDLSDAPITLSPAK